MKRTGQLQRLTRRHRIRKSSGSAAATRDGDDRVRRRLHPVLVCLGDTARRRALLRTFVIALRDPQKERCAAAASTADALVIFGITGELARKMTFRSLYRLERRGLLGCPVVGVALEGLER